MMNSKVTYRQQFTRCGKQRCRKCREGSGHGPYWYAYWSEKGRTVSKYIGINLPENVEAEKHYLAEEEKLPLHNSNGNGKPSPVLRIYLLGQFRLERKFEGEWRALDSRTWHRRRARVLLGCLLSNTGRRLGREQVMQILWPDLDTDLAANRLNGAVHELRQILEPDIARPATSRLLRLERDVLELADGSQIWVDAEEFENVLKEAEGEDDPKRTEQLLEDAAALYRGSYLLEELYSEWATPRRDALQRAWVGLLLKQAHLRAEHGAYVSAIETLDRLRTADPTNETALQHLMILLTQLDRRGEALQAYNKHVTMLERDYEGEPLPETVILYEKLLKGFIPHNAPAISLTNTPIPHIQTTQTADPAPLSRQEIPASLPQSSFTRPAFQSGRHNQSPLIGRDSELETLRHVMLAIEGAHTMTAQLATDLSHASKTSAGDTRSTGQQISSSRPGHTHFLLLKGEAGIGKTRLAEELSLAAYTRGWTVAWSRSYEQEGTIPYRPWTELLRTLLPNTAILAELAQMTTSSGSAGMQDAFPFKIERLGVLLPELAQYTASSPTRTPTAHLHEQERLHLWETTLGLLGALSHLHPLLLVLDDLHWADESSIELLTYLIHHLRDQRVLLVGTCRDGELAPQHKLRTLIADLQREQAIALVSVLPLTFSQIGTLLAHLPQNIVYSIQAQAAGNPFFAEELARFVSTTTGDEDLSLEIETGEQTESSPRTRMQVKSITQKLEHDITQPQRSLPEAIAAVLERRLNRMSNGCQLLLSKAAVLGGSFELNQLQPMATEYDEDSILDLLEEALRAGLLTEEVTGNSIIYHFWHPLIINHLYSRLSAARRAQLHRKAAEAIKTAYPAQAEKAAAIAYHLSKGSGDATSVAYYAEQAGNQAYSLTAYSEAQQYYLQALYALIKNEVYATKNSHTSPHIQLIIVPPLSQLSISAPLRVSRLLERVGECGMVAGNFADARQIFEALLELRTSKRFQQQVYGSTPGKEERQQEAQIQALLWREISIIWSTTGEYEHAYTCYQQGKEILIEAAITTGAAWAGLHRQYAAILRQEGRYHEARRFLQEALEMLEQVVQQQQSIITYTEQTPEHTRRDILISQAQSYNDPPTRTERILNGDPREIGFAHEGLGIVAASLGQMDEAIKQLHIALASYEHSELVSEMAQVCGNLGSVYMSKGEYEAARKYMHRSLNLAERAGDLPNMAFVMLNLGEVTHRSGDLMEAEGLFKQSLTLAEQTNYREGISWCSAMLSATYKTLGDLPNAAKSIIRAIKTGRMIKNTRCIRFALIGLADLRIAQALTVDQSAPGSHIEENQHSSLRKRLLLRAQATLQRALTLDDMEVEHIIDGKYSLASVYFLLGDLEAAQLTAWQTHQEAQKYEITTTSQRVYRLLGRIQAAKKDYQQASDYFEQALQLCRKHDFKLDYARALHTYGAMLVQHNLSDPAHEQAQQRGLEYLHEAHKIFVASHAIIDLHLLEQDLAALEPDLAL